MCLTFSLIQNIASHTNTKRDTSSEIDPYAAYYEYYANQQASQSELPDAIASNQIHEKQGYGYADTMRDAFGSDAGVRQIFFLWNKITQFEPILNIEL